MKKILSLFMAAVMLVSLLAVNSVGLAPGDPYFEVSNVEGVTGDRVEVAVSLKNSPGFGGIAYDVCYNPAQLKIISYELDLGKNICTDSGMDIYPNKMNFQYAGISNINGDGVLVSFVFEIIGTEPGTTEIKVIPEEGTSFYYEGRTEVDFEIASASGTVTIVCGHTSKTEVPAKSADCIKPGNNQYFTCDTCGAAFKADGTETTVEAETIAALDHDYKAVVTAPTCTEQGYTTYTCSRCNDSYKGAYVDALDHDYKAVVTAPNCTEKGYTTHTCSRCDNSYVDTYVDALDHRFGDWVVTTAPTCTAKGVKTRTCTTCGETETRDVDALDHDYKTVVTAPNCTEKGYTTHTCSRCDNSYVDAYVDALDHDYVATVTAPNCTEKGYTTHTCSRCSDSYVDTYVNALDHSYETVWSTGEDGHWHACSVCGDKKDFAAHDFGEVGDKCVICDYERAHVHRLTLVPTVEATCTASGTKAYYACSGCEDWFEDFTGNIKIEDKSSVVVAALDHDYKAVVTAPTCTEQGYTTYTCSRCNDSYKGAYVDALDHDYKAVVTAPNCTEKGYTTHTCSRCDNSYVDTYVDALDHDYKAVVTAPTCTEKGYTTHTCSRCDNSYVDTYVDALDHDYKAVVTAPTCTEKGYTTHTCSRCSDSYVDTYVNALDHSYETVWSTGEDGHWHACSVCGDKKDFAAHDFGEVGDKCLICDYERAHVHRLTLVPAVEATCTTGGTKAYYTCSGCEDWFADSTGNMKIEDHSSVVVAALDHDYKAVVTAPTCTEKGYTTHTCSRCDNSYVDTYVDALDHDYKAVVTAPTCTEKGYTTHTCSRCDNSYVDTYVDALDHDYKAVVTAPTCTEKGYTTHTCSRCSDSYKDTYVDTLSHSYSTAWSKGEDGHWHACSVCGDKKDFAAHDFGTEGDKCLICDYERAHVHRLTLVPAVEATCTTGGTKAYYTCSGCEDWFADSTGNMKIADHSSVVVAALGHDWQDATCTAPKTCKVCGETVGEANGHTASDWMTDETSHWKVCTVCEEVIADSKADHADTDKNHKCDVCGKELGKYENVKPVEDEIKDITSSAEAPNESNPLGAVIQNSAELETLVNVTAEEKAQGVTVWLEVMDITDSVSDAEKQAIENAADDKTVAMVLDASVFKKVGAEEAASVHDLGGKMKISITVPENLRKADRTFSIVRIHGGVATLIEGTYADGIFTFETDRFSTYGLVYTDRAEESAKPNTPATGDNSQFLLWAALVLLSAAGIVTVVIVGKKKQYDEKYVK